MVVSALPRAPRQRGGDGLKERLRARLLGLPTTRAGVEILLAGGFIGWRGVALGQLALSLPVAWDRTTSRPVFGAALCAFVAFSVALTVVLVRERAYRRPAWAWADVSLGAGVLLSQQHFVLPADLVGSWTAWGFAVTVNTTYGAVIALRGQRNVTVATFVLAGSYLVASLPAATRADVAGSIVSNSAGYVGFALLAGPVVGYLRRLGSEADESREAAARAARRAEADRHRLLLHDHATVLRLLSEPTLDPALAELLRRQAAAGSHRVRAFLARDDAGPQAGPPRALPAIVAAAAEGFDDLPVELSVDLASDVVLDLDGAHAVERAICTVLHNVRVHAEATHVLIHADAGAGRWEVTVRDDGVGFDPGTTRHGFGLGVQVTEALAAHGIRATIESAPGEGTTVVIDGVRASRA